MNDEFILTIEYKGSPKDYPARLLLQGYIYKIMMTIDEVEVYFERDEEVSFRVVKIPGQDEKSLNKIDKNLLSSLTEKIKEVIK